MPQKQGGTAIASEPRAYPGLAVWFGETLNSLLVPRPAIVLEVIDPRTVLLRCMRPGKLDEEHNKVPYSAHLKLGHWTFPDPLHSD